MESNLSIEQLRDALESVAVAEKAAPMAAYMKNRSEFLGVSSPDRKEVQKPFIAAGKGVTAEGLIDFVDLCWEQPEREFQYVGMDLLRRWVKKLGPEHMPALERFVSTKAWWDTVDALATNVVGPLVKANPDLRQVMDQFIDDPDIWIARTAIIHQLKFKDDVDTDRLYAYALRRAADTEFFIRKAIGWSLRQHSRVDPDGVAAFVAEHEAKFSGLTKRHALGLIKKG